MRIEHGFLLVVIDVYGPFCINLKLGTMVAPPSEYNQLHVASSAFHKSLQITISDIPLFGVLTMKDKMESTWDLNEKCREFREALGLPLNRFLLMSNYCDDIYPELKHLNKVKPSKERFMQNM